METGCCTSCCRVLSVVILLIVICITPPIVIKIADVTQRSHQPEISLRAFSVSNLSIVDDKISGNWSMELGLKNPARKTGVVYSDLKYTLAYSSAPGVPIVDSQLGFFLVQRPKNQTAVCLHDSVENSGVTHQIADSMTRDVIDGGVLEFDVAIVVLTTENSDDSSGKVRLVLACNSIKVSISPSKLAPVNAIGRAREISGCHLIRHEDI